MKVRRNYWVKPKLQLKYLLLLGGIIIVLAVLIYYTFLDILLSSPGMDQLSAGAVQNFIRSYTNGFLWVMLLFILIILIESIFYFHRIVGPIFFFERIMKQLANGEFFRDIHYRRKDDTKELALSIGEMIKNVRDNVLQDKAKIEEIKADIDKGDKDSAKKKLDEIDKWFKVEQ